MGPGDLMKAKITKRFVDSVCPGEREITIWDSELPGFILRVTTTGHKGFFLRYRTKGHRERKPKIGDYGAVTPDEAREIAKTWLRIVAEGGDPSSERMALRTAPTMDDLRERYMKEYSKPNKVHHSHKNEKSMWARHIIPRVGTRKVVDIEDGDMGDLHKHITKSGPVVANRCMALLSCAFTQAEKWKWRGRGTNPCRFVKRNREKKRKIALNPQKIQTLGKVLNEWDGKGRYEARVADFFRLMMLTGARPIELVQIAIDDIDRETRKIAIPKNKENNPDKTIPLGPAAWEIVKRLIQGTNAEWLFPSSRRIGRHIQKPATQWRRIRKAAKLGELGMYGLRHTFASTGIAQGLSLEQIGGVLGHSKETMTETYGYLLDDPRRKAADSIDEQISNSLFGPSNEA